MDQMSKPSGQVLNNGDSDSENFLISSLITIQSSTGVIISTSLLPHLHVNTSTISTADSTNVTITDIIEHIGGRFCGTVPSLSFFLFSRFPLSRIPRGLPDIVHRSLLPAFGSNSGNRGFSSQSSHASISLDETGLQNATDIDVMRRQYVESALFMYRMADSLLEGLMSLMILAADTEASSRLAFQELLALENHIGNVNTGLSEETVTMSLRHSKIYLFAEEHAQKECCSICQEDYEENDELVTLICGHGFHTDCIKHWLRCKNFCPICKSTGLDTTYPS